MTDVQKILKAVSSHTITADTCDRLIRALDAIPEYQHSDFLLAFFHDEPELEEQPEDYAIVKTFDSQEFHVGDEVVSKTVGSRAIVTKDNDCKNYKMFHACFRDGSTGIYDKTDFYRTGRNFPAIQAILQELKKGVDKSAQNG